MQDEEVEAAAYLNVHIVNYFSRQVQYEHRYCLGTRSISKKSKRYFLSKLYFLCSPGVI